MGAWFRLRADFDASRFSPENQVIIRALQRYGMILADNGSSWFISGAPDERWRNDRLRELLTIRGSDLEAVDVASLKRQEDSGATRPIVFPAAVRNAASGAAGPIAPGQIVSIYGTGLGPREGVAASSAVLPFTLGGTSVRIGDQPAAILYASQQQVNAVVPFGVSGPAPVVVSVDGKEALRVTSPVAPTAPDVFRFANGTAVTWNADGSFGAVIRGSIVSTLATGDGDRLAQGELSRTVAPVRAWIGAIEAEVLYSGGAPGLPAPVAQINLRIPANAPLGLQPLTLRIGSYVSTPGAKVEVR